MTSVQVLSELQIYTDKVQYNKKEKRLTIMLTDFTFVGQYKPSSLIGTILDDLHAALTIFQVERSNIFLIDGKTMARIPEDAKLKEVIVEKKEEEEKEEKVEKDEKKKHVKEEKKPSSKTKKKSQMKSPKPVLHRPEVAESRDLYLADEEKVEMEERQDVMFELREEEAMEDDYDGSMKMSEQAPEMMRKQRAIATSTPEPGASFVSEVSRGAPAEKRKKEEVIDRISSLSAVAPPPKIQVYDINMGLQYYPVVMVKQRYLFYVHLSHKKLKIEDEEGKVVYETTFRVVTTKPEPPRLDLTIEGEGFEIHPLSGRIEVKKKAVNPPLMIFSIMATKVKKKKDQSKKEKKKGITRYLHVKVDYEGKNVSHTVLAIKVQPKFFKLGPLSLSKSQAMIISLLPILITVISFTYSISQLDLSGGSSISGMLPGGGTLIFAIMFLYTLIKKGIFPMKKKVQGFLDFDKGSMMK
jgi:hypothetical protein